MTTLGAVVVGTAEADWAEDGVDGLFPIATELGQVARATVDPGAAMPGVEPEQPLEQAASEPDNGGANRQLDGLQTFPRAIAELAGCPLAEALYLG